MHWSILAKLKPKTYFKLPYKSETKVNSRWQNIVKNMLKKVYFFHFVYPLHLDLGV